MSISIHCNFQQFARVIESTIITKLKLQNEEQVTASVRECFEDLKEISNDDEHGIKDLLHELVKLTTKNKFNDDKQLQLIDEICSKLGLKFHEMDSKINSLSTQLNKFDNESDRTLWDPTIRRKSDRNPGDDPRDGSVVLDPIESDYRQTVYFRRL